MTFAGLMHLKEVIKQILGALKGKEFDYTKLPLNRSILLLAVPMVMEMVMESLFAIVDIYFASKLGKNAVATIGFTESVLMIVYSLGFGVSMAATAIVARRFGEKKYAEASHSAGQTITIGLIISFVISFVGIFYSREILVLMGADIAVIETGSQFTKWMLGGNYVIILLFLINGIFRGAGNASKAMYALWVSNGLNIILDPILMFGWGPIPAFGVVGAAYATNIGRTIGVLFQLYVLFNGKGLLKVSFNYLKPSWVEIKKIIKIASGASGQFLIASASWIFLMRIIAQFGSQSVAAYTIGLRLLMFSILPAWGLANAAATLVGQNLGANQPNQAEKSVWRVAYLCLVFLGLFGLVYYFFAEQIISFFTKDPTILKKGIECLQYFSFGYLFFAFSMVVPQAFNGAGDTRTPTVLNLVAFWALQIPTAYILATHLGYGPQGVYVAFILAEFVLAGLSIWIFKKGKWKTVKV